MIEAPKKVGSPSFGEALEVWLKIALQSFGGPAGQIAVMHKYLVEEKKWIGESRFLHALHYCMLLPGPEAQQLVTYTGWLLHGKKGGVVAGALFVLPGFVSILVLSIVYAQWKEADLVAGLFYGIKPAVLAIVAGAVIKIGKKTLKNEVLVGMAVLAFVGIFFFQVSFPLLVLGAGVLGYLGGKLWEGKFVVDKGQEAGEEGEAGPEGEAKPLRPRLLASLGTAAFWAVLWWLPVLALALTLGLENIFTKQGLFFSQSALVTFGGAYSVLAYISQKAVETYGWLQPSEMLDGLGMAETTPGPLIQVVQFVGFMGAYRQAGPLHPVVAGGLASVLVTWVTYLPSFLFIFTGAPYIEYLRGNKHLTAALSAITAAVVGVMLNLGLWLSLHTLFGEVARWQWGALQLPLPVWPSIDWAMAFLSAVALYLYFGRKWTMLQTIGCCAVLGLVARTVLKG